jgi:hypothetical protein
MYKLKEMARRGVAFMAALGLLSGIGASALPAVASADALNPLTERSLTLSSSSPGWSDVDGSGNEFVEGSTWPTYAPPNSGPNGKKTGETFTFRVSSDATVKAFTFQYCTTPAGFCLSPGNNATGNGTGTITTVAASTDVTGSGTHFTTELKVGSVIDTAGNNLYTVASIADDTNLTLTAAVTNAESGVAFTFRGIDNVTNQTSDLNVVLGSGGTAPAEINSSDWATISASASKIPARDQTQGNFVILVPSNPGVAGNTADTLSSGWSMSTRNLEDHTGPTGKNNFITLSSSTGAALQPGDQVKVIFYATDSNYITNPGDDAFFVKINDYNDDTYQNFRDGYPDSSHAGNDLIDGGVTVANIMNESIQIQTKVLETMDFSVGIIDPDTLTPTELGTSHGQCDPILTRVPGDTTTAANSLFIGDGSAEDSLATGTAYDTHSFWRLSSNSSGGATVYYSGETLSNTEGDQIKAIGTTAVISHPGTEQFGLAIDHGSDTTTLPGGLEAYPVDPTKTSTDTSPSNGGGLDTTSTTGFVDLVAFHATDTPSYWHNPRLYPLVPETIASNGTDYGLGSGTINPTPNDPNPAIPPTAKFAFDPNANTVPVPIASENTQVVDCVTAKMRYVANIAATTPAGIYATKINYLAAPQY